MVTEACRIWDVLPTTPGKSHLVDPNQLYYYSDRVDMAVRWHDFKCDTWDEMNDSLEIKKSFYYSCSSSFLSFKFIAKLVITTLSFGSVFSLELGWMFFFVCVYTNCHIFC